MYNAYDNKNKYQTIT